MSERPERARLFVALDLPAHVRADLAAWATRATGDMDGLRLLEEAMLHVTLAFLGWRDVAQAARIGDLAMACAAPVPELSAAGAAWLPPRRPRVLAVDLTDARGDVAALQRRVSDALAAGAAYEPERRPFRPHVTVARVPKRARVRAGDLEGPEVGTFAGSALTLYCSRLERAGARYEPVARTEL